MDNNKSYYTAADYARYHRGELSAAEMHAMERAALQDPFIQDALDGYVHTSTGEADVELLRKRLAAVEKKEILSSRYALGNLLKIAAVFLIATTVAFLIYNTNNNEVVPKLAEVKTTETTAFDTVPSNETAQANPTSDRANDLEIKSELSEKNNQTAVSPQVQAAPVVKIIGKDIVETKALEKVGSNYKVDGTIVSDEGMPLANATIISEDKKLLAKTDDQGKFEFETKEADLSTTINNEGYQARNKTFNANQSSTVVLKEQVQNTNMPNNAVKPKVVVKAPVVVGNVAQPGNGWDDYNVYLKESTAIVYNEAGVKQTGSVVLNFEIDKTGSPHKITVKKSDCKDCNLAAVQVLKDGPKWVGKPNIVNEIAIKF